MLCVGARSVEVTKIHDALEFAGVLATKCVVAVEKCCENFVQHQFHDVTLYTT